MSATTSLNYEDDTSNERSLERRCAVCQSVQNLKRCSRCKSTFYCCRNHQRENWPLHKNACKIQTARDSSSIPIPIHVSATSASPSSLSNEDDIKSEIESILDFRSLKLNDGDITNNIINGETNPNSEESCDCECSKDIFSELHSSDTHSYMGPSDNAMFDVQSHTDPCPHVDFRENENFSGGSLSEESYHMNQIQENSENLQQAIGEINIDCIEDQPSIVSDSQQRTVADNSANQIFEESITPLDDRPLRKLKFPRPESYEYKDLAEFISLRLINLGYCILDELFEESHMDGINEELKHFNATHEIMNEKLATESTCNNEIPDSETNAFNHGKKWIYNNEEGLTLTSKAIFIIDSIMKVINPSLRDYSKIEGRTEVLISCDSGNGGFHRRQVDNPDKDGRRIACMLFVDKDWDLVKDGGLLRILPPHLDKPIDIPPKANRIAFFWSDKRNPYEVHPIYRMRLTLTVWYYDRKEKEEAKLKELKSETDLIAAKITELEEKRRQVEEATRRQTIENKAMEAVRSLSDEELEALSLLVYNHPQPQQVMTAMGISPCIQDALITYLGNL